MQMSWFEIVVLYLCLLAVAGKVMVYGIIYRDPIVEAAGALACGYALFRVGLALVVWLGPVKK